MNEQTETNEFDVWYQQLITVLAEKNRRAPYKMAWIDLFTQGLSPEEASLVGPWEQI